MRTLSLKDAKSGLSGVVDSVLKGEFVTITRHGKPVAAVVPIEAAEAARKVLAGRRKGLVAYLRTIPSEDFERNPSPSRDVDL